MTATMGRMPNVEKTPRRTFRAGEEWDQAQAIAAERGDNLSEILRAALKAYVKKNGSK